MLTQNVQCNKDEWMLLTDGKLSITVCMYLDGKEYSKGIVIDNHKGKSQVELINEIERQMKAVSMTLSRAIQKC